MPGGRSIRRWLVLVALLLWPAATPAQTDFVDAPWGDHFLHLPRADPGGVLVIAHGTRPLDATARDTARLFLDRWTGFAEATGLIVIVPVFDDARFGNTGGGYGGYRGLFGREVMADALVLDLIAQYGAGTGRGDLPVYLYGHSAGGQFAGRFVVQHPERVAAVLLSAPGRYSFPDPDAPWPYGAGLLERDVTWPDGQVTPVRRSGDLDAYARAAGRVHVLVGAEDLAPQPARPGHVGDTRVALAVAWTAEMNALAARRGWPGRVDLRVVPGIGHDSAALTPHAQAWLLELIAAP